MSTVIDSLERAQLRRVPAFQAGDRVRVHFQVIEGTRRRTQVFEGVVIKRQGHGARETFTVRKQSFGVGVERTFPVHSPKIEKIEVAARGDVRRAKLYYLRDRVGKRARVRERRYIGPEEVVEPGLLHDPAAQLEAEAAADRRRRRRRRADRRGRRRRRGAAVAETARPPRRRPGRAEADCTRRRSRTPRRRPPRRRAGVSKAEKSTAGSLVELVVIVAVALGLALGIQAFLVKPYRIPSESMVPTLEVGQRVLVNRIGNRFSDPAVGDVVVFHPPAGSESNTCGNRDAQAGPGLRQAHGHQGRRQLHQARRRRPGRHDRHPGRPRHPQRQAPEGAASSTRAPAATAATSRRRSRFRPTTGS